MRLAIFICFFLSLGTLAAQEILLRDFHENGKLLREWVRVGKTDTAVEKIYHENGNLNQKSQLVKGVKNGESFIFDEEEKLLFHQNFRNNKLDGALKCFYPSGQVSRIEHFRLGFNIDTTCHYGKNGVLQEKVIYLKPCEYGSRECNKIIEIYKEGKKVFSYKIIAGLKSDEHQVFDEQVYKRLMEVDQAVPKLEKGKAIFTYNCGMCHRFDMPIVGPVLKCITEKYTKEEIFIMLTDSDKHQKMPLSEVDFDLLINYIEENCQ